MLETSRAYDWHALDVLLGRCRCLGTSAGRRRRGFTDVCPSARIHVQVVRGERGGRPGIPTVESRGAVRDCGERPRSTAAHGTCALAEVRISRRAASLKSGVGTRDE